MVKDSKSLGSTLSFILADSNTYSSASNETIISRIWTMHIKWVLNYSPSNTPRDLMSLLALQELGKELELRSLKLQLRRLEKQSVIHSVSWKTHLSPCQTKAMAGGLSEIQGHLKIMQDPKDESWVLILLHNELFRASSPSISKGPHGTITQAASHSPRCTAFFLLP